MRKVFLSALVLLGSVALALAQDSPVRFNSTRVSETASNITRRACGTMEVLAAQLAADPAQAQRMAAIETQTRQLLANPALNRTTAGIVIIPVVVHVLYNTAAQNISDAQM